MSPDDFSTQPTFRHDALKATCPRPDPLKAARTRGALKATRTRRNAQENAHEKGRTGGDHF